MGGLQSVWVFRWMVYCAEVLRPTIHWSSSAHSVGHGLKCSPIQHTLCKIGYVTEGKPYTWTKLESCAIKNKRVTQVLVIPRLVNRLFKKIDNFLLYFGSKTIVYSFSNCNFQRNVKLIAFLIVCDKGVHSQMPSSLVWTKNLRCFENQQKYMYHEIRQGMTRTSLRKRDCPK